MAKEIITKKAIIFTIIMAIAFGILLDAYNFLVLFNVQSMTLTLNYENAEEGLTPDGSRFNVYEMISDEVLQNALVKAGMSKYTPQEIKSRIDIISRMPYNVTASVISKLAAGTDYSYLPNTFTITYSQKQKFGKNHTDKFLRSLADSYRDYFNNNYTQKNTALNYEEIYLKDLEYIEIAELYEDKISSMKLYLLSEQSKSQTYKSENTSETFGNLINKLDNLCNIQVQKFKSFVTISSLAKDRNIYIQKLDYDNEDRRVDYEKAKYAQGFIQSAMDKYDPRITAVIFIPSLDEARQFYMNKTKTGLDYLASDAYSRGVDAENINAIMQKNNYIINILNQGAQTTDEESSLVRANEMMLDIDKRLKEISDVAIKTDDDFLTYKTEDYLKFAFSKKTFAILLDIIVVIKGIILGIILSAILLVMNYYRKKYRKEINFIINYINGKIPKRRVKKQ